MKGTLAALLILSLALSSNRALFPVGDRAVVIRIDDIQDYDEPSPYAHPEKMVLQYHIDNRIPALLSIIPTRFGRDPQLVDQVKEGLALGIFTVAIHGWHHSSMLNLSRSDQVTEIQYAKNKLENLLDSRVLAFVPPYNEFNKDTIYAVKTNGLTLLSSSIYLGDIPREEDGVAFLPQTVTTAVVSQNDTWTQVPLESVTKEIKDSWESYGVAVMVIHPRQFIGTDSDSRWLTYVSAMEWIISNTGRMVRFEPRIPETKNTTDPLLISVGIFAGLTSTLLVAFNMSAKKNARTSRGTAARRLKATFAACRTYLSSGFHGLRAFTKITVLCTVIISSGIVILWWSSGRTYPDLGISSLGFPYFGVGLSQGKIYYSSMVTFLAAFALAVAILVEKQSVHPVIAIVVSAFVVLSGAYLFEYVYLFLNHQVLFKYLDQLRWWFSLMAGFVIGFGFKFMKITRRSIILFSFFALSMIVWYLAGYPQLADKETPVFLYRNYLGVPLAYAFPLNASSELLSCLSVVSLLKLQPSARPVLTLRVRGDAKTGKLSPQSNAERAVAGLALVVDNGRTGKSIKQAMLGRDSVACRSCGKWNPVSAAYCGSCRASLLPAVSCRICGRTIARDDRYCDRCGSAAR